MTKPIALPFLLGMTIAAVSPGVGAAQAAPDSLQELDRVVAVVGDSVILLSQVLQREAEVRAQGAPIPQLEAERDRFLGDLLDELVTNQILVQAAARDTLLSVDDDRVTAMVQERIGETEQSFGGRADMERALQLEGLSMQTYREMLREQIRQSQLVGQYVARHASGSALEVTDLEIRTFFEGQRGALEQRPATVSFKQVVLTVAAGDSATTAAKARVDSLLTRIQEGEDFAELAKEHSQDPASAVAGGDLGWFRRGNFVEAFEDAAFNLLEGEVSEIIETPFGYHILKVDQIRFSERRARHILIRADIDDADMERTTTLANDVLERAKTEDFEALIEELHDPLMPDSATVPLASIGQMLSPEYESSLRGRSSGDIVGPISFEFRGEQRFAIISVLDLRDAGSYAFEDLKEQIRTELLRRKRVENLVDELRRTTHVELKTG